MKNKSVILGILSLIMVVFLSTFLVSCGGSEEPESPSETTSITSESLPESHEEESHTQSEKESVSESEEEAKGVNYPEGVNRSWLVNGFDSNDDLYNTKIMNGEWKQEYKANIVYDKQFVKQGEGSLKIERISGEFPEFYIRFANALLPEDFEVKKTHVVGLWVYNANDTDADIIINLRNVQNFTVLSKAQTAKANGWTRIECDFSEFAWAKKDVIGGFSISVNGAIPSEIYYDGLSISDDAEEVVVDLNALIESIVAPDSVVTYATFKENAKFIDLVDYAMGVYQNMSAEDKKAVKPTNLALLDKYSKMFPEHKVVYSSHRDVIMRWAYGAQMAILEEIDDTFGGVWSISVNTEKEQSWYNVGLSGNDMDKYERVVFWIYNPTDQDLRLTLSKGGWKPEYFKYAEFELLSHEWTEISIPMADFRSNFDGESYGNIYCLFYRTDYKSIKGTFKLTSYFGICGESAITDSAQAIVDAIDGLVAVDGLTEDNQEALEAIANVRKEYDKLSDTEKAHINNYSKLVVLEEKAFSFKMDKLRLKMNGLNDPLTKDDATAVFEIYEEYSQFTDLEKSMMDDKEESAILEAYETLKVYIVDAYIAELPDVNELNAVHFGLINTIAERYDTLSNEQKSALENGEKLLAYLKVLEEYTVITDYSKVSDIRLGSNGWMNNNVVLSKVDDYKYGELLKIHIKAKGSVDVMPKAIDGGDYDEVTFAILNPFDIEYRVNVFETSWAPGVNVTAILPANGWGVVTLDAVAFFGDGKLPFMVIEPKKEDGVEVADGVGEWFVTPYYGYKSTEAVNAVIGLIDMISDPVTKADADAVKNAREAYDALSVAGKRSVTNYEKLENAEAVLKDIAEGEKAVYLVGEIAKLDGLVITEDNVISTKDLVDGLMDEYNKLSDSNKAKVTNIGILDSVMGDIESFKYLLLENEIDNMPSELTYPTEILWVKTVSSAYAKMAEYGEANIDTAKADKLKGLYAKIKDYVEIVGSDTEINIGSAGYKSATVSQSTEKHKGYGEMRKLTTVVAGESDISYPSMRALATAYDQVDFAVRYNAKATVITMNWMYHADAEVINVDGEDWLFIKVDVMKMITADTAECGVYPIMNFADGGEYFLTSCYARTFDYTAEIDEVNGLIAGLPTLANLTVDDEEALKTAREKYEALTSRAKLSVDVSSLIELEAKMIELKETKTAGELVSAIAELNGTEVTSANINEVKVKFDDIVAKYNALSDSGKAQVTNADLIATIESEIGYMLVVIDIDELPAVEDAVIPRDIGRISAVNEKYNGLSNGDKANVTNADKLNALVNMICGWEKTTYEEHPFNKEGTSFGTDTVYGDYAETASELAGNAHVVYFYPRRIENKQNYAKLSVYIYNTGDTDVNGYYNDWESGSYTVSYILKAKAWTRLDFTDHYISEKNNYLYMEGTFRFSAVYGQSADGIDSENANHLMSEIAKLDGLVINEENAMETKAVIDGLLEEYAKLSDNAKAKVTNLSILDSLQNDIAEFKCAVLENLIDDMPTELTYPTAILWVDTVTSAYAQMEECGEANIDSEKVSKLKGLYEGIVPGEYTAINDYSNLSDVRLGSNGFVNANVTKSVVNDSKHGELLKVTVTAKGAVDVMPKATDGANYDKVLFAVYNPYEVIFEMNVWDTSWSNVITAKLPANAWGVVELDADKFFGSGRLPFMVIEPHTINETEYDCVGDWLITRYYGYKSVETTVSVTDVINGIAGLPTVEDAVIPRDADKITAVNAQYNGLSDGDKASVTNADKLNALVSIVFGWSKTGYTEHPFYKDGASYGTDTVYGDYVEISDSEGTVYFYPRRIADKQNYVKLSVYVYNTGDTDVNGYYNDWEEGNYNVNYVLKAKAWTKLDFTDHYISEKNNYLYMKGTFRFSAVYGQSAEGGESEKAYKLGEPFKNMTKRGAMTIWGSIATSSTDAKLGTVHTYTGYEEDNYKMFLGSLTESEREGLGEVTFCVYNPNPTPARVHFATEKNGWCDYGERDITCPAKDWTVITFDFDEYPGEGAIYFYANGGTDVVGWKITDFYAEDKGVFKGYTKVYDFTFVSGNQTANDSVYGPIATGNCASNGPYFNHVSKETCAMFNETVFFYIYNPLDVLVKVFCQEDVDWTNCDVTVCDIHAWTKICLRDTVRKTSDRGFYLDVKGLNDADYYGSEGWKITGFYQDATVTTANATYIAEHNLGSREHSDDYGTVSIGNLASVNNEKCPDRYTLFHVDRSSVSHFNDYSAMIFYVYNPNSESCTMLLQDYLTWNTQYDYQIDSGWSKVYIPGSVMKTLYTLDESFDMYVDLGDDHANKAQGWKVSALLGYSDEYGPFYGAKKVFDVAQQAITIGCYNGEIEIDKSTMVDEPIATVAVLNSQVSLHIKGIADLSGYKKIGFKFYSSVDGLQFSFHHSWNDWELSPVLTLHEGMNTVIIDASWICENALYPLSSSTDVTGHFAITDIYAF